VNDDSTSIFKVFRVLWFPMSINAVALGAVATLLFYLVTWLFMWIHSGLPNGADAAAACSESFLAVSKNLVLSGGSFPIGASSAYKWVYLIQFVSFFLLWATFGVAICRIIALRIARDEYCSLGEAWRYAWRIKLTGILYPLALLLPILGLAICNAGAGLVGSIPYVGWLVGVILIPLVLVSTVILILIAVAGLVGVGLMPAAIAVERKGTYDSLGKSFNFIFARPLPLILYVFLILTFLEIIHGLFIDRGVVENVMKTTLTPFGWTPRYDLVAVGNIDLLTGWEWFCALLHWLVMKIFHLLVWGAILSYALGAFTSMFLIFRQDVDGLEYEDVARDPAETPPGPAAGAPEAEAPPATDTAKEGGGDAPKDSAEG
jgi:hypothetical protein